MAGATAIGACGRQAQRREQIVGQPAREAREEVRARRRDQHQVGPARELDVSHGRFGRRVPQLAAHAAPETAWKVVAVTNSPRRRGHHDLHFGAVLAQPPHQVRALVGGDAAGHTEQDAFALHGSNCLSLPHYRTGVRGTLQRGVGNARRRPAFAARAPAHASLDQRLSPVYAAPSPPARAGRPSSLALRSMSIRDWPGAERPREKLLERGAHALSDAELLALLLGSGVTGRSAVDLARDADRGLRLAARPAERRAAALPQRTRAWGRRATRCCRRPWSSRGGTFAKRCALGRRSPPRRRRAPSCWRSCATAPTRCSAACTWTTATG